MEDAVLVAVFAIGGAEDDHCREIENWTPSLRKRVWRNSVDGLGHYTSFSRLVNHIVTTTEEEYLFFVNPKTQLSKEQLVSMLADLQSGFAWTSRVAFGLWACHRQLFRVIGLMDERFLGGEYEDLDFGLRLKHHDIASNWVYRADLYNWGARSRWVWPRRVGQSVFDLKWRLKGEDEYLLAPSELKLWRYADGIDRQDIQNKWKGASSSLWDESWHIAKTISRAQISISPEANSPSEPCTFSMTIARGSKSIAVTALGLNGIVDCLFIDGDFKPVTHSMLRCSRSGRWLLKAEGEQLGFRVSSGGKVIWECSAAADWKCRQAELTIMSKPGLHKRPSTTSMLKWRLMRGWAG